MPSKSSASRSARAGGMNLIVAAGNGSANGFGFSDHPPQQPPLPRSWIGGHGTVP